jgi:hypothetical protein
MLEYVHCFFVLFARRRRRERVECLEHLLGLLLFTAHMLLLD